MDTVYKIIRDFWRTAFFTWLVLLLMELFKAGLVQRFINLEYYFYGLFFLFLVLLFFSAKGGSASRSGSETLQG